MTNSRRHSVSIGPAAFVLCVIAALVFFWWLLIYDHGLAAVQ